MNAPNQRADPQMPAIFCRICGYCLAGASQPRCSECGEAFNPNDPRTFRTGPRRLRWPKRFLTSPLTALSFLWLFTCLAGELEIYLSVLTLAVGWLAAWKRWRGALLVALANPLIFLALVVGLHYFVGHPSTHGQYIGSAREFASIDPRTRTPKSHYVGCQRGLSDWYAIWLADRILRGFVTLFGPVRDTYLGPFPTHAQAFAAIRSAASVSLSEAAYDRIQVGQRTYHLSPGIGPQILSWPRCYLPLDLDHDTRQITAVESPPGVLIVAVPALDVDGDTRIGMRLALIDPRCGRVFAYYYDSDAGWPDPPVPQYVPSGS